MKADVKAPVSREELSERQTSAELTRGSGSLFGVLARALAAIPLFYRLMAFGSLASAGIVIFAVWVTSTHIARPASGGPHWGLAAVLIAVGLAATLVVNFTVMRMGFRPIGSLTEAMEQVRRGQLSARARHHALGDAQIDRLIDSFNEMAESLQMQRAQLAQLSSRVLAAHEEERRRVARELHDEAGQALTSLLLDLKGLERVSDAAKMKKELARLRDSTSQTLEAVRRLARNLRPPVLDDLGFAPALASLLSDFERASGLRVRREITDPGETLSRETEVALFRVAQEALTNVAKHARSKNVRVKLEREGDVLRLEVEDDGAGFDVNAALADTASSLGLYTMQDRLALLEGILHVESSLGRGTTVVAEVPVTGQEP